MKISTATLLFGAALATTLLRADPPTVNNLMLNYNVGYTQTDLTTVGLVSNPYTFEANIDGSSNMTATDPLTSVGLSWQNSALVDQSQALSFQDHGDGTGNWQYKSAGYADQTSLLNAYPGTGGFTYSYQKTGGGPAGTANLTFTPSYSVDLSVPQVLSASNGTWSGGAFHVTDINQAVVFTFNDAFAGTPGGQEVYHYDGNLSGNLAQQTAELNGFLNSDPTGGSTPTPGDGSVPSFAIAAGSLVSGETYALEVNYAYVLAMQQVSDLNAFAVALLQKSTSITLMTPAAVPEPAETAIIAGLLALLGAIAMRKIRARG